VSPRAALVVGLGQTPPDDWPLAPTGASDAALAHLPGWSATLRADDLIIVNPLGEGLCRAALPAVDDRWENAVRETSAAAVYLLDFMADTADPAGAVDGAAAMGQAFAATIRTAFADDYGQAAPPPRNAPCPCGSGRKYKQCCGSRAR
jgi:hypothetical protein